MKNTSQILVKFDSDYDGIDCLVPYFGVVSRGGKFIGTIDVYSDSSWQAGPLASERAVNTLCKHRPEISKQVESFVTSCRDHVLVA
jgi:hypothetical protein